MLGLMMDRPLLTTEILKHAMRNYPRTEIVTRTVEGPIHRYTIKDSYARICRLSHALTALGVKKGDRVGVIGWNTYRQFEMYYAVGGLGAVLHTINPRLHPDQIAWIANDAEDVAVFFLRLSRRQSGTCSLGQDAKPGRPGSASPPRGRRIL